LLPRLEYESSSSSKSEVHSSTYESLADQATQKGSCNVVSRCSKEVE
jgi:hypothetical protein